jgi:polysaccharide deacetylase family protein (PEP-CTERM system associated)
VNHGGHRGHREPTSGGDGVVNALSFDVEDYFQVSNFEDLVPYERWDSFESRVERNTERILAVLADHGVRATFFILGWVAERFPGLVRSIAAAGHELGTHGYRHRLIYTLSPAEFRDDLRRSIAAIEGASGRQVLGHRAPSFSITRASLWAVDVLKEEGLRYDSSIFPVRHPRYGIPGAAEEPFEIAPGLVEFPMSVLKLGPLALPVAGGGYFRLYPWRLTRWGIRRLNRAGRPAVVYLHPWELDPDQPRVRASWQARFRHYVNLHRTETRLHRLCAEFAVAPLAEVLGLAAPAGHGSVECMMRSNSHGAGH